MGRYGELMKAPSRDRARIRRAHRGRAHKRCASAARECGSTASKTYPLESYLNYKCGGLRIRLGAHLARLKVGSACARLMAQLPRQSEWKSWMYRAYSGPPIATIGGGGGGAGAGATACGGPPKVLAPKEAKPVVGAGANAGGEEKESKPGAGAGAGGEGKGSNPSAGAGAGGAEKESNPGACAGAGGAEVPKDVPKAVGRACVS